MALSTDVDRDAGVRPVPITASSIDWTGFLDRPLFSSLCFDCDSTIVGKTVLVTGAGGSIGSALVQRLVSEPANTLLLLDHSRQKLNALYRKCQDGTCPLPKLEFLPMDIRVGSELREIFSHYRPHIVFHTAAMKHLAPLESDPFRAFETNVLGTLHLVKNAGESEVDLFVNISTDKAVDPTSVLGISKRISELLLLAMGTTATRWITLRLGNVLGSSDSVVPLFIHSIEKHQPLYITDPDASRYFVTFDEVVAVLLKCLEFRDSSLLLPHMGSPRRISDLADFLIRLFSSDRRSIVLTYLGLRDGEKCSERLIYDYEYLEETAVPRLYRINGNGVDRYTLKDNLGRLVELIYNRSARRLIEVSRTIVPEFTPSPTLLRYIG